MITRVFFILTVSIGVCGQHTEQNTTSHINSNIKTSALKSVTSEFASGNVHVDNIKKFQTTDTSNFNPSLSISVLTSPTERNSIKHLFDLSHEMNKNKQESQFQQIFDLNDIKALGTLDGEPTVPDMFSHGVNLQTSPVGANVGTGKISVQSKNIMTQSKTNHIDPHQIPKPSKKPVPVIIPFNVNGNAGNALPVNPNRPEAVWIETTNSIINTRNSPPLHQNSLNLSPNQEIANKLSINNEERNIRSKTSPVSKNLTQSHLSKNGIIEPINTMSFGLSLKNQNIAELVNGFSNENIAPETIDFGNDATSRGEISVNGNEQQRNNEIKHDTSGTSQSSISKRQTLNFEKESLRRLGNVQNVFDNNGVKEFGLLSPQVMSGLSTGNNELLERSSGPAWIQSSNQNFGISGASAVGLFPMSNLESDNKQNKDSLRRSLVENSKKSQMNNLMKHDSVNPNKFAIVPSVPVQTSFVNVFDGLQSTGSNFVSGVEALNNQNNIQSRNSQNTGIYHNNKNVLIGDKEIEQIIRSVITNVDQSSSQRSTQEQNVLSPDEIAQSPVFSSQNTPNANTLLSQNTVGQGRRFLNIPSPIIRNIGQGSTNNHQNTETVILHPQRMDLSNQVAGLNIGNRVPWSSSGTRPGQSSSSNAEMLPNNRFAMPDGLSGVSSHTVSNNRPTSQQTTSSLRNWNVRGIAKVNQLSGNPSIPDRTASNSNILTLDPQQNSHNIFRPDRTNSARLSSMNIGQSFNVHENTNLFGRGPSGIEQHNNQFLNSRIMPVESRASARWTQGARTMPKALTSNENSLGPFSSTAQMTAIVLNQSNVDSNSLGQIGNLNGNRLLQELQTGHNFRILQNGNILNQLLQSIDLPKNLPSGRFIPIMIYPMNNNNTMSGDNILQPEQMSSLVSQVSALLSHNLQENEQIRTTPQRSASSQTRSLETRQQPLQRLQSASGTRRGLNSRQLDALQKIISALTATLEQRQSTGTGGQSGQDMLISVIKRIQQIGLQATNTGQQQTGVQRHRNIGSVVPNVAF